MAERPVNVLRYGSPDDLPETFYLRSGPLTALFYDGDLRYIRLGPHEILRRVYVAVRDQNWDTILATLSDLVIEQEEDSFEIRYHALHQQGDVCFAWDATLTGSPEGEIRYQMDGEACSTFLRNRIGICVLHPTEESAGAPCRVTHTDGSITEGTLPRYISPHQPYKEIEAIAHQVTPGLWADVKFSGDVFEMEDQRNWTDASFKTYSTPLELPFPVRIDVGTPVRQSVTLSMPADLPADLPLPAATSHIEPVTLALGDLLRDPLPPLGLGMASHGQALSDKELQRLRALGLAHLRVDLEGADTVHETLGMADAQATSLEVGLEIALPLAYFGDEALASLADAIRAVQPTVLRWLLLTDGLDSDKAQGAIAQLRGLLEKLAPAAAIAVGVNAYFTELNRTRPPLDQADLVCYSLNPQVHAFDNLSLIETLPAQAITVESARQFVQRRPVVVSPVTLRPRFNPNATSSETALPEEGLPDTVDVRQMSLLGAGWTLASLKHLMGHPDVHSLTYYETTGWRGVMERPEGPPSAAFPSRPGEVFPLYHVLRWVGGCSEGALWDLQSSEPLCVDGLALEEEGRLYVGVANLTNATQQVELYRIGVPLSGVILDESNVVEAMADPDGLADIEETAMSAEEDHLTLELAPYAVAWLECPAPQGSAS